MRAAVEWWQQNRPAAPKLLAEELERAFALITQQPGIDPTAPNVRAGKDVQRFHLSRISYHLYYRVRGDRVEVLAFWHASRGSGPDV
jgi:plasmid stabilization system protein ParE